MVPQPHMKLKQLVGMSRGRTENCLKVPQLHGKLPEADGKSSGCTEHLWKVPWMHKLLEKVTEGPFDEQRVDACWQKVLRLYGKLMEVDESSADARKVNRWILACTES